MKKIIILLILVTVMGQCISFAQSAKKRVLVFSKTITYYHESIPAGIAAIQKLGAENDFKCRYNH